MAVKHRLVKGLLSGDAYLDPAVFTPVFRPSNRGRGGSVS